MSGNVIINDKVMPHVKVTDYSRIDLSEGLTIAEYEHEPRLIRDGSLVLGTFLADSKDKYLILNTQDKDKDKIDLDIIESIKVIDLGEPYTTIRILTENSEDTGLDYCITDEYPMQQGPIEVFDEKGRFQAHAFAPIFTERYHVIRIDGCLYYYDDGHYIRGTDEALRGLMMKEIDSLTFAQRQEVLSRLKDGIREDSKREPDRYIAFRNCIYDREADRVMPLDPSMILTNQIPWDYVENPEPVEEIDKLFSDWACGDKDIIALLQEVLGCCMCRGNPGGKIFILIGDKKNGKSTYLRLIERAVGEDNVSHLSLQDLEQKYRVGMIQDKTANLGDDIPDTSIPDASMMKRIATGEPIVAEQKFENPRSIIPCTTPIFSANVVPMIEDPTGAIKRRLYPVAFNAEFHVLDSERMRIDALLTDERAMSYLVSLGIEGLRRVSEQGFSMNEAIDDTLNELDMQNNPVVAFIEEYGKSSIIDYSTTDVYDLYRKFCQDSGFKIANKISFVKRVCSKLNMKSERYGKGQTKYFRERCK